MVFGWPVILWRRRTSFSAMFFDVASHLEVAVVDKRLERVELAKDGIGEALKFTNTRS